MGEERNDPYESTARWLEEPARRRPSVRGAPHPLEAKAPAAKQTRERTLLGISREIYMLGVLAAVYLNYYYMQVMLEIDSLPRMVLFYPLPQ